MTVRGPLRRAGLQPRAAVIGVTAAVVLIVAGVAVPAATGWNVYANHFPPLHAKWLPHVGWGTFPAVAVAVAASVFAVDAAQRLSWRRLLAATFAASVIWFVCLALVDGPSGLGAVLDNSHEYLRTARSITDVGATLRQYIERIPLDSANNWPTHVAGHPPGAVLFFWALVRLGLGDPLAAGGVVVLLGATVPVAIAMTLRRLGAEGAARRALPFLALGPAAIWMAVSGDGMFTAVAAWGLFALAMAATSPSRRAVALWAVLAGVVLGFCVFLSYGLVLLAVLAVAVLVVARSARPLPWALGGAIAVTLSFAAAGFAWWQAYPVLVERYWDGIATRRPSAYWVWGNLAALSISAGPLVGSSVAVAIGSLARVRYRIAEHRAVLLLTLAAAAIILLADASGMSKAEVERIWLPFVPWLLVGTALLSDRWRRRGLAVQLGFALVVQHLLDTGW